MKSVGNAIHIGTAGWSIPRSEAEAFPDDGSGLQRYSAVLECTEINSTFYRSHLTSTYARWADSVPEPFRFSVKAPKALTHEGALEANRERLRAFLEEVGQLGPKLGPILFQLPPRQNFLDAVVRDFFSLFRDLYPVGPAVVEPRHMSWLSPEAEALFAEFHLGRVVADPSPIPAATEPGGDLSIAYFRLHGSPRTYYSSYSPEFLVSLAATLTAHSMASEVWCLFDNTASGAAMGNALALLQLIRAEDAA